MGSEAFDIASLGPGWAPYNGQALYSWFLVALRVPTEIGTRTIVGTPKLHEPMGDGDDQVTIAQRSGLKSTYSVKHIVAFKTEGQKWTIL